MSNSAINTQVAQLKVGNVQNQADSSSVYSNGVWSFKNSTALTSVTITDAGNVGVGVTPSAWGASNSGHLQLQDGVTYGRYGYTRNAYFDGASWRYIGTGLASQYLQAAGMHQWLIAPSGTAGNAITYTEAMRIDSSGNVGIGMAPFSVVALDVKEPDAGQDLILGLTAGTGARAQIRSIAQPDNTSSALSFSTTSAGASGERMRIDASGNLAIAGTANTGKITITQNTQSSYQPGLSFYFSATSYWNIVNGASSRLYFGFANGVGGYTDKAYVDPPTGAWTPVSDARAKKNIETISYGLNDILQLNPVKYNMNEEDENTQKHLGFIAQEVKQVIAEAVTIPEDEERLLGLDKTTLIPVLVKAIQELSAKVDAQAEEIKALKAK